MEYSRNLNATRNPALRSSKEKPAESSSGAEALLSEHLFIIHFSFSIYAEDIWTLAPNTAKRPTKNQYPIFSPSSSPSYCLHES
jgi:hypothetical protein